MSDTDFPPNEYVRRRTAAMIAGIKRRPEASPQKPTAARASAPSAVPPPELMPTRRPATPGLCRRCSAPITWGKNHNDKSIPLNADGSNHLRTCSRYSNSFTGQAASQGAKAAGREAPLGHYSLKRHEKRVDAFLKAAETPPPDVVDLYVDGACLGNGNEDARGAWGVYILDAESETVSERNGVLPAGHVTNNRSELTAAIEGLTAITEARHIRVYTDSQYVLYASTKHCPKPSRPNRDLIVTLAAARDRHLSVTWFKVKGHSGNAGNARADRLAAMALEGKVVNTTRAAPRR